MLKDDVLLLVHPSTFLNYSFSSHLITQKIRLQKIAVFKTINFKAPRGWNITLTALKNLKEMQKQLDLLYFRISCLISNLHWCNLESGIINDLYTLMASIEISRFLLLLLLFSEEGRAALYCSAMSIAII